MGIGFHGIPTATVIPWVPQNSHGKWNKNVSQNENGIEMGIKLM